MAARDNPFYVQPTNIYEALISGVGGYDRAQKSMKESERDAILQQAGQEISQGGLSNSVYGKLFGLPGGAGAPLVTAAAALTKARMEGTGNFGTPIYGTDANNRVIVGTIQHQGGKINWLDSGGNSVDPPIKLIDGPQGTTVVNSRGGRPIGGGTPQQQGGPQGPIRMPSSLTPQGAENWIRSQNLQPGTPVILPDGREGKIPGTPSVPQSPQPQGFYPKDYTVPESQKGAAEKAGAMGAAKSRVDTTLLGLDQVIKQTDDLLNSPGLTRILGTMSLFPSVPGGMLGIKGDAANAQAKLDRLKSQVALESLTAMREASKTGGAVGQVTEREYPILESKFANLRQAQTPAEFRKATADLKNYVNSLKANIQKAYEVDYGGLRRPTTPIQPGAAAQ